MPSENRKYPFRRPEALIVFFFIRTEKLFQLFPSNALTLRIQFEDWFAVIAVHTVADNINGLMCAVDLHIHAGSQHAAFAVEIIVDNKIVTEYPLEAKWLVITYVDRHTEKFPRIFIIFFC